MTTTMPVIPLNDADFYASDPFEVYRLLRDDHPVYWCESGGFWGISRHEDVLLVQKDSATFCNGEGMTMRGGELEHVKGGDTLITMDPPQHTQHRKLINRSFSKRAVGDLEARIRTIAREILDETPVGETIDFVDVVAARLPVIVIAELLGVPVEDRDPFVRWSNAGVGVADPEYAHLQTTAMLEQYDYFEQMLAARRHQPRDDLLSVIVAAEDDDSEFTHHDALSLCFLLLAAGNETTRNLVTHSVRALSTHPDQLEGLRRGWSMEAAVEELLRWVSPVIHMARTVTGDTELRGQKLRTGDQVVMIYGAANRDERAFGADAEDLVLDRNPNAHLSLGFGQHYCLGAALARLEAKVMLEEIVDRYRDWSIVGTVERLRSTMILGIKHMPVVLEAGPP